MNGNSWFCMQWQESISSARNYLDNGGMYSLTGMKEGASKYSMSVSMYRGGARGYGRPRTAPPDLPSLLLDARIVYLGMPVRQHLLSWYILFCIQDSYVFFQYTHFLRMMYNYISCFVLFTDSSSSDRASCCSVYVVGLW